MATDETSQSVDIDPSQEGALYEINLALSAAYAGRRLHAPGTAKAREWTLLIDLLEDLQRTARIAADARFDPSGL